MSGLMRFDLHPEALRNTLGNALRHIPKGDPAYLIISKLTKTYDSGFVADKSAESMVRFSHILGSWLKPAMELYEKLESNGIYYCGGAYDWDQDEPRSTRTDVEPFTAPCAREMFKNDETLSKTTPVNQLETRTIALVGTKFLAIPSTIYNFLFLRNSTVY